MRRVLVAVLVLLACAACDSAASGPAAPAAPPPQRTVDVTAADPCALLTTDQRAALGIDWPPGTVTTPASFYDTDVTSCVMRNSTAEVSVQVAVIDNTGIERYDDKTLLLQTENLPGTPLPALLVRPTDSKASCKAVIGIGPGRLIDVYAGERSRNAAPASQEALCDFAVRAADDVMATITR